MYLKPSGRFSLFLLGAVCSSGVLLGCKSNSESSVNEVAKREPAPIVKAETSPTPAVTPSVTVAPKSAESTSPGAQFKDLPDKKWAYEAVSHKKAASPNIKDVKTALRGVGKAHSLAELSPHLTNESAGAMAMPNLVNVMSMSGFMQKVNSAPNPQPDAPINKHTNVRLAKVNTLLKRYSIDINAPADDDASINKIELHGRALLKDLSELMEKLSGPGKPDYPFRNMRFRTNDKIYEVVSPTEVKLTLKNPKDLKYTMKDESMRFEDGAWRMDFGGVKSMMKQMQYNPKGVLGSPGTNASRDTSSRGTSGTVK